MTVRWLIAIALMTICACSGGDKPVPAESAARLRNDLERAAAAVRSNQLADGEAIYRGILEIQPDQGDALAGLGRIRLNEQKLDEALDLVQRAVAAKGDAADIHGLLGDVLSRLERHEEAAAAYGKAFGLEPDKSEYGLPYGIELKLAKQYGEAEKVLRKVSEIDPMARYVFTELGDVLREQNRIDEALKIYMKAQRTHGSDKLAHAGAALVYEANGDTRHALDEWSSYIRMDCCSEYAEEVAKKHLEALTEAANAKK